MSGEKDQGVLIATMLIKTCQGNPGAARVLAEIRNKYENLVVPLCMAMSLTDSRACYLWFVYKNICKYDIDTTMHELRTWFDNSCEKLDVYLRSKYPDMRIPDA